MSSKPFHFKQFTVEQDRCSHKVGTDGVLLGAWVNIRPGDKTILDVGTGSGVIALMLAQRLSTEAHVDAVENERMDVQQARDNVSASPWPEKINVHHRAVQGFFPESPYDLIVSNPPYFTNSQLPPDNRRSRARHTHGLSFEYLLQAGTRLLKKEGRLALILPHTEGLHFLELARGFNLFPIRKTSFRARANKPVERILIELAYHGECQTEAEIVLYKEDGSWSEEYGSLTRAFYLNSSMAGC